MKTLRSVRRIHRHFQPPSSSSLPLLLLVSLPSSSSPLRGGPPASSPPLPTPLLLSCRHRRSFLLAASPNLWPCSSRSRRLPVMDRQRGASIFCFWPPLRMNASPCRACFRKKHGRDNMSEGYVFLGYVFPPKHTFTHIGEGPLNLPRIGSKRRCMSSV